jgi:diaminopimelate decarboxylase
MIIHDHFNVNEKGHLTIGGADAVELAARFGTPAYILDENVIRANCRRYREAAIREFGPDALPLYASKALCFKGIYEIAAQGGMGVDGV